MPSVPHPRMVRVMGGSERAKSDDGGMRLGSDMLRGSQLVACVHIRGRSPFEDEDAFANRRRQTLVIAIERRRPAVGIQSIAARIRQAILGRALRHTNRRLQKAEPCLRTQPCTPCVPTSCE